MIPETTRAYLAGLIDGEGYIGIEERGRPETRRCKSPSFSLALSISMTDKAGIELIAQSFGERIRKYEREDGRKPYYVFSAHGNKRVRPILEAILPYVQVKKPQVELALAYLELPSYKGGHGRYVPADIVNIRKMFVEKIHSLNGHHKSEEKL